MTALSFACARCGATFAGVSPLLDHGREVHATRPSMAADEVEAPVVALYPKSRRPAAVDTLSQAEALPLALTPAKAQRLARASKPARSPKSPKQTRPQKPARPSKPATRRKKALLDVSVPARRRTLVAAAAEAVDAMTVAAPRHAQTPMLPAAKQITRTTAPLAPSLAAPVATAPALSPRAVPSLQLGERQVEIAQGLYDGRVLLTHLDAGDAWWADIGRGRPVNAGALAGLLERKLVAPYGWETSARIRRLMLTDEGRVLAGRIEFEFGGPNK